MRLDPDDQEREINLPELIWLYTTTHDELRALETKRPSSHDLSEDAQLVRLAMAECHGALRALGVAIAGRVPERVGECLAPLVSATITLN